MNKQNITKRKPLRAMFALFVLTALVSGAAVQFVKGDPSKSAVIAPAEQVENPGSPSEKTIMIGYLWGWTNIGDAAIAPGLLNLLTRNFPDYNLQALCYSFKDPEKSKKLPWHINRFFPDCKVLNGDSLKTAHAKACAQAKTDLNADVPVIDQSNIDYIFDTFAQNVLDYLRENDPAFYDSFCQTDLFIYTSGCVLAYGPGTLGGNDFWGYCLYRSLPLLLAKKLGIPYGVFSHTFDAFKGEPGYSYFKELLEDAAFVFCRDTDSLRYLLSINIKPKNFIFVPDSTFSSIWKKSQWADDFMKENCLSSGEFMAVIIHTPAQSLSRRPKVSPERAESHMEKIREVVKHWVHSTSMKAVLCPEVTRDIEATKMHIYDKLDFPTQQNTVWINSFWTHDQAKALYARARLVVSMELHSLLLSLPEGTPIIHLPFAEVGRKSYFITDMGLSDYLLDIDRTPVGTILERVDYIHKNHNKVTRMLKHTTIPYGRERERAAVSVIRNVLKEP